MPPLFILPGTACDPHLFDPLRPFLSNLQVLPWQDCSPDWSIADYAAQLAATIEFPRPFHLAGVSLGAMVAHELALRLEPDRLILISCPVTTNDLFKARLVDPVAQLLPSSLTAFFIRRLGTRALGLYEGGLPTAQAIAAITKNATNQHLTWASRAIPRWRPPPLPAPVPLLRIHGTADLLVPFHQTPHTFPIENAGHLLPLTHSKILAETIRMFTP